MTRRKQKLSRGKSRTMWLAWLAWGVIGSIFMFEDTAGGSGTLAFILTSPFWLMFVVWPILWAWLKTRKNPEFVEIDDDITAEGKTARLVQKDGVRYVETLSFSQTFGVPVSGKEKIPGGGEDFTRLDDVRRLAQENPALAAWLAVVDSIASP